MEALITAAGLGTRANLPSNMRKENIKVYYQKIKRYDWISIGKSENYYKILKRTYDYCKKLSP